MPETSASRTGFDAADLKALSHELRTPLNAVIGYADALADGALGPMEPRAAQAARTIGEAGRRLLGLIQSMTDLGHLGKGGAAFAPIDGRAIMQAATDLYALQAERAGLRLQFRAPVLDRRALGDSTATARILDNLLSNALKFSPHGGVIRLSLQREGDDICFAVEDSGPGPTADPGSMAGEGIGLTLARTLAERQGGRLVIEPGGSGGTIARLLLPAEVQG